MYFLMEERSRSKSIEETVLQVRLDSPFAVFIGMYKASNNATHTDAGEQIYLSRVLITNYAFSMNETCTFLLIIRSL